MRGSSLVDSFFSVAPADATAILPRGRELPFRLNSAEADVELTGVVSALPPLLFMLFTMSRTERLVAGFGGDPDETDVISPDLRSTPTIDQGLGLGNGLGLTPWCPDSEVRTVRGLTSGDLPNLEARRPTMDPPSGSGSDLDVVEVLMVEDGGDDENSVVGDVKFPANPVDLLFCKPNSRREKREGER